MKFIIQHNDIYLANKTKNFFINLGVFLFTMLILFINNISFAQDATNIELTENELLSETINLQKKVEILVKDETNNIELLTQDYLGKLNTNCPNIPIKDFLPHSTRETHKWIKAFPKEAQCYYVYIYNICDYQNQK